MKDNKVAVRQCADRIDSQTCRGTGYPFPQSWHAGLKTKIVLYILGRIDDAECPQVPGLKGL